LRNAYFGDLHLHTSLSFDAYILRTNTRPNDSYAYAKGQPVTYLGKTVQRKAALDFLAVTDHAEYLGVLRQTADPQSPLSKTEWAKVNADDPKVSAAAFMKVITGIVEGKADPELNRPAYVKAVL